MVFYPARCEEIPNVDLLSWIFGGILEDEDRDIYIDVLDSSRRLSFRQAHSIVRKLISGLKHHGIKPGDSVLLHSFGEIMYPMLYLGIIGSGASFIGSNPSNTPLELSHLISHTSTKYVITSPEQLSNILLSNSSLSNPIPTTNILIFNTPHNPTITSGFQSWETLLIHGESLWETFSNESTSKERVSSLFSTSGTTGTPKIAAVSHRASIARCIASYDPHPKPYAVSRLLCLPMFNGVAATASHMDPLRYGIPTYILPRFSLPSFLAAIQNHNIAETFMVPTIMSLILEAATTTTTKTNTTQETKEKLSTLRLIRCAGAPLDTNTEQRFKALLHPEAKIQRAWGLTEFGTATSFLGEEKDETGSCGRLLSNVEAKIIDANGIEIHSENTQGEVLLKGPSIMKCYLSNEEATKDAFEEEGWFKTGDIAYVEAGKWYLVGRSKDMIKVRGWQVAPAELESCIMQHPLVLDVAVIGIRSPVHETELPRAYIVLKTIPETEDNEDNDASEGKVTEEEIKEFLLARLARYKALDGGVKFVDSLPKTASGKTVKRILREEAAREMGGM